MDYAAALIYWPIVAGWTAVAILALRKHTRSARESSAMALLLSVILIDAIRNILENLYFGLLWGGRYGVFPQSLADALSASEFLIIPKIFNVVAVCLVLVLLVRRYVPTALDNEKRAERELEESEQRLSILIDSVKEYAIYRLDTDGNVASWNAGAERIKGYSAAEAIGMNVACFYTEEDRQKGLPSFALEQARLHGHHEMRGERVRKDGSKFWASVAIDAICDSDGQVIGFAKVTKDVTRSHAAEKMLEHQARHDRLTGLANRAVLFEDMRCMLGKGQPFGLAIFDLDGFKDVNDTNGHLAGDRLLKSVAKRIVAHAGSSNSVYRLGGDEFVLVVGGQSDPLELVAITRRIIEALERAFTIDGSLHHISASAGISLASEYSDAEALLANADLALYEAKAGGGRGYKLFIPAMRAKLQARRSLDAQLRMAHDEGHFDLHFQPQVALATGKIAGAEALLRWRHPQHGLVEPPAFIDALSRSPVAIECGRWIINEACRTLAHWRAIELPIKRVAINLFQSHFRDPSLEGDIQAALRENGLSGDMLEIEITENIALQQEDEILAVLHRLRDLGVQLAFDDFGTGYASLSCLASYPLTHIKIDRSFVSPIEAKRDVAEVAIVRPMITMAHYLGLEVIAEGIETQGQADFLRSLGCEEGQGFLFGKAMPAAEFEELVWKQAPKSLLHEESGLDKAWSVG